MTDDTSAAEAQDDWIDPFATFTEWAGDADHLAFADLCDDS